MGISYGIQWVYHKVINLAKSLNPLGRSKDRERLGYGDSEGNSRYCSNVEDVGFYRGSQRKTLLDSSMVSNVSSENEKGLMQYDMDKDVNGLRVLIHRNTSSIDQDIEHVDKCLQRVHLLQSRKKREETKQDLVEECFVPLTEEEDFEVARALSSISRIKVLVSHENSNIDITGEILHCLSPRSWLNDEVINLYFELLKERENREPHKFLKCHFFSTFFYKKLISDGGRYNFQSVRRWTSQRKLGYRLSECDKIFVPIHKEIHWCLAVINKKDKKFQYLDSYKGADDLVLPLLAKYYVDEVKDKSGINIDVSSWEHEYVSDLPEQENGFDCGMFMIKYADFISRDIELCFNQGHIPYFRRRTVKEILNLRAD